MLIDLNMNPSPQGGFIVAQDRSFLKPRRSGKSGTSQIVSFEHAKASAALAASCKRACRRLFAELTVIRKKRRRISDVVRSIRSRPFLDPFMIHEAFPSLTETASGSHPCCVVSVTYGLVAPFHGGNTGSNPVGDAIFSTHYERAPRCRRWKLDGAPPPLRCAVQGLRSATAALGEGTGVVCPAKRLQQGLGKLAGEWHFTLGER
jgi:hypothetical protein